MPLVALPHTLSKSRTLQSSNLSLFTELYRAMDNILSKTVLMGNKRPRSSISESKNAQQQYYLSKSGMIDPLFSQKCSNIPMQSQSPASRRRRVRFDEDPSTRRVRRKVIEVESASDLTPQEKSQLWFQRSEVRTALAAMASALSNAQLQRDANFSVYVDTLTETYLECCASTSTGSAQQVGNSAYQMGRMAILGACDTNTRGLETHTLPLVAADRLWRRSESSRNIIQLHQGLGIFGQRQEVAEIVKDYAVALSLPSQRFAQALGVADATAALLVHAESSNEKPLPRSSPAPNNATHVGGGSRCFASRSA